MSRSPTYYYDHEAIQEDAVESPRKCGKNSRANVDHVPRNSRKQDAIEKRQYAGFNDRYDFENPSPKRTKRTVWEIAPQPFRGAHFATFPEKLVEPCVLAVSAPGDLVLDPFAGSCTTAVVALRHDRNFVGCELSPAYAEIARKRVADSGVGELLI